MRLEVAGVDIHYEQHGAGADVVLLHGWQCDRTLWRSLIEALAPHCRVTAIDFPAHGQSGRPPEAWGVPAFADCTLALLDALDIRHCDLVAHSFGARVSIWMLKEQPARFGRAVFTGAAGIKPPPTQRTRRRQKQYRALRRVCDSFSHIPFLRKASGRAREALVQRYGSSDYVVLDEAMRAVFREVVNLDLRPYLSEIQASTLLFWGEKDDLTPLWMGQMMQQEIPDAGLVVAQGAGHYAYLEQAAFFERVVKHFLLGAETNEST